MSKLFKLIAVTALVSSTFYGDAQYQADRSNDRSSSASSQTTCPTPTCPAPKPCPTPCAPAPKPCAPTCPAPKPCPKPCPTPCPAPRCEPKCDPCEKPRCPKPCPVPCPCISCDYLERGMEMPEKLNCFPAAYNAPANILLKNCPWGVNVTASFLYWHVSQSGMFAAAREPSFFNNVGTLVSPSFKYKPGFKVGLGFNTDFDDWTGKLEYTWMHQRTSSSSSTNITAPFAYLNWIVPNSGLETYFSIDTKWKMNLDRLDLVFSRPYYQGQKLTISPVGGLRGQWIRQSYQLVTDEAIPRVVDLVGTIKVHSHSWAVGPVAGATTNWLLGSGFRLEGKAEGALLYTRYTKISQNQSLAGLTINDDRLSASYARIGSYGTLRPMAELGVGLGWGSYFCCQDFYFDLSARYDFNVLWDQNVMVSFVNAMNGVPGTSGDLYLHGLTLTARFDF